MQPLDWSNGRKQPLLYDHDPLVTMERSQHHLHSEFMQREERREVLHIIKIRCSVTYCLFSSLPAEKKKRRKRTNFPFKK